MQNSTKTILIACGVLALIGIVCVVAGLAGAFSYLRIANTPVHVTQVVETTVEIPRQSTETVQSTQVPASTEDTTSATGQATALPSLPPDVLQEMDKIQQQVVDLRGLGTNAPFHQELITTDQLRQHMAEDMQKNYSPEDAAKDVKVLAAFGLVAPDFDYYNFYLELLTEQVSGFYDQKTKTMYVIQGEGFQGPERMTYAHEYDHFLQDSAYDLENGLRLNDKDCKNETERCSAVQALVEGDASLLSIDWLTTYATPQDLQEIQSSFNNYKSPVYDSAPDYMKQDFLFPYQQGQAFVTSLYEKGGWQAVDRAFRNPPQSTEQILHPERYPNDVPVSVDLPAFSDVLGSGWTEIDRNVVGEWYTYLILAHGLDPNGRLADDQAKTAAEGWGGDEYSVWYNDSTKQTVLVLKTTWETEKDAGEFASAFQDHANALYGNGSNGVWQTEAGITTFHQAGAVTTWIFAPDSATADALWQAVH